MIIDNKVERHSARDAEVLIKVGLHIGTIICADHTTTPAVPKNMTNYTDSEMRINNAFCKAYSGRMLRHNAVITSQTLNCLDQCKIANYGANL